MSGSERPEPPPDDGKGDEPVAGWSRRNFQFILIQPQPAMRFACVRMPAGPDPPATPVQPPARRGRDRSGRCRHSLAPDRSRPTRPRPDHRHITAPTIARFRRSAHPHATSSSGKSLIPLHCCPTRPVGCRARRIADDASQFSDQHLSLMIRPYRPPSIEECAWRPFGRTTGSESIGVPDGRNGGSCPQLPSNSLNIPADVRDGTRVCKAERPVPVLRLFRSLPRPGAGAWQARRRSRPYPPSVGWCRSPGQPAAAGR